MAAMCTRHWPMPTALESYYQCRDGSDTGGTPNISDCLQK